MWYFICYYIINGGDILDIGERIRAVRKQIGLNQTEFGKKIGLQQSSLGQIEIGVRTATDRTIFLISEKYNVNENWLRTGEGNMFVAVNPTIISELSQQYKLDNFEKAMIECYLNMHPDDRKVLKEYVHSLTLALEKQDMNLSDKSNSKADESVKNDCSQELEYGSKEWIEQQAELYKQELLAEANTQTSSASPKGA